MNPTRRTDFPVRLPATPALSRSRNELENSSHSGSPAVLARVASVILGPAPAAPASPASQPGDTDHAAEIATLRAADAEHQVQKYFDLVLIPMAIVAAVVLLLRRGLFS